MIEVKLLVYDQEWAIVRIADLLDDLGGEHANYRVDVGIRDATEDHLYRRNIHNIPKYQTNPLGLLRAALESLPEEAFRGEAFSPDLARRLPSALPEV